MWKLQKNMHLFYLYPLCLLHTEEIKLLIIVPPSGNTWGVDGAGEEGVGKGPQETFINCADIIINTNTPTGFYPPHGNQVDNPWALYFRGRFPGLPNDSHTRPLDNGLKPLVIR